jgi:hypothetical protein
MAEHMSRAAAALAESRVSAFTEELFGHLPRADQRRWAQAYLQGLLVTPGKKSVRRLASAVSDSPTASQSLQQFINASPWDWRPARQELTRVVEQHAPTEAWSVATAVLPKRGDHSCGVHRRFVPSAGRTVNCQVGVGVFLSSGGQDVPVDWRLLLPDQWDDNAALRERTRIPPAARHRPLWAHTLDLVDTLASRTSQAPAPVVADMSEYPDAGPLVEGLSRRGRDFVIAVPGALAVVPSGLRTATPDVHTPLSARQLLYPSGTRHPHTATLAAPDRRLRSVRILSGLARLHLPRQDAPAARHTYRLFTQWRPAGGGQQPARMWITNLVDRRIDQLLALSQLHRGTTTAMRSLEQEYGLLDFEGRSYPGWHHHMTLVSAAYTYNRLVRPAQHPAGEPVRQSA